MSASALSTGMVHDVMESGEDVFLSTRVCVNVCVWGGGEGVQCTYNILLQVILMKRYG